jgi:hypothetical protein
MTATIVEMHGLSLRLGEATDGACFEIKSAGKKDGSKT